MSATVTPPPPPSIEELLAAEARLDRAFAVAVAAIVLLVAWSVYLRITGQIGASWVLYGDIGLALVLFLVYVRFGLAVREAAARLGKPGWAYLAWVLIAPCLSFCPIPFLSQALVASPLILKFLLSSQLRSVIHQRTFAH